MMPVECPNKCNMETLLRKDLPEHSGLCPLEKVKCPFHVIGCEVGLIYWIIRKKIEIFTC